MAVYARDFRVDEKADSSPLTDADLRSQKLILAGLARLTPDIPIVAEEADAFLRQEAQHARAHRLHANAMIARYPGLAETFAATNAAYDDLLEREDIEFHLAYVANLEATFTPLFKMVFDNRRPLFEGGDERVGTMLLWHFVEEIEHRSSAYVIYNAVVPDRWYRLRMLPAVFKHMLGCHTAICRGFDRHVPFAARLAPASDLGLGWAELRTNLARLVPFTRAARDDTTYPDQFAAIPRADIRRMLWRLIRSQHPRHSPETEETPPFADDWLAAYERGRDVVRWYDGQPA